MAAVVESHTVNEVIAVYLQANSKRWYARVKASGQWLVRSTGKTNKNEAIVRAIEIHTEFRILERNGVAVNKKLTKRHTFTAIAELAIVRMKDVIENGSGMRIGTEIDNLTWGDFNPIKRINGEDYATITVRKGKTTRYNGTREIV